MRSAEGRAEFQIVFLEMGGNFSSVHLALVTSHLFIYLYLSHLYLFIFREKQRWQVEKMADYYKIMGLTKSATTEEIKKAYKKLAVKVCTRTWFVCT